MFRIVFSLLLILDWCDLFAIMMVCSVYASLLIVCYFLTGDRIEQHRVYRGRGICDYQGEDQGQAEKGKPSKLVAYLILDFLLHDL
jgi:hypothetical protein